MITRSKSWKIAVQHNILISVVHCNYREIYLFETHMFLFYSRTCGILKPNFIDLGFVRHLDARLTSANAIANLESMCLKLSVIGYRANQQFLANLNSGISWNERFPLKSLGAIAGMT